ncbi:hypothetical protein T4D_13730 [Trichinella pseudospiralis]|uniref:Uncharacterized protein n=1 Tax=Trichinella pseudospiralis TaxID=6337 RepID=A0A0V1EIG1_TRIPS|nr:hypothetical protein T4D_13730 [Trichinella pseudospiralis]
MCINIGDAMFWEPFIPQLMARFITGLQQTYPNRS